MEEIPRPREAPPEPTIRSEQASEGPTPDTTMTTTMDDSILAESVAQSEKFQNVPEVRNPYYFTAFNSSLDFARTNGKFVHAVETENRQNKK